MSWAGCQNNPIDLNFPLQKSLETFEKKSADKIWSNKDKGIKMPCPVPDRVRNGWPIFWIASGHFLAFLLAYSLINTILHSCIVAHTASTIAFLSEINDAIRFFLKRKSFAIMVLVIESGFIFIFTGNLVLQFESEPFICICCIKIK